VPTAEVRSGREGWHNVRQFYDLMLEKKSVDAFWEKVLKDLDRRKRQFGQSGPHFGRQPGTSAWIAGVAGQELAGRGPFRQCGQYSVFFRARLWKRTTSGGRL
jgi:hypothetical protein